MERGAGDHPTEWLPLRGDGTAQREVMLCPGDSRTVCARGVKNTRSTNVRQCGDSARVRSKKWAARSFPIPWWRWRLLVTAVIIGGCRGDESFGCRRRRDDGDAVDGGRRTGPAGDVTAGVGTASQTSSPAAVPGCENRLRRHADGVDEPAPTGRTCVVSRPVFGGSPGAKVVWCCPAPTAHRHASLWLSPFIRQEKVIVWRYNASWGLPEVMITASLRSALAGSYPSAGSEPVRPQRVSWPLAAW